VKPRLLSLLLLVAPLPSAIHADSVQLLSGETVEGAISEMQAGYLLVTLASERGVAQRRINPDRIESLRFEDQSAPLSQRALRRARFQALLTESDAELLPHYLQRLVNSGKFRESLSYAKQWHPKNDHEALDAAYRRILIQSSQGSGSELEAVAHAKNWIQQAANPTQHTLPWETLAIHHLESGDAEAALWTALRPIADSQANQGASQRRLIEIASQAYLRLGYEGRAAMLLESEGAERQELETLALPSLLDSAKDFDDLLKTRIQQ